MDFSNKTAVVTGGTRGIGAAIVEYLLENNCHVIATGTAENTKEAQYTYHQLDLANDSSLNNFCTYLTSLEKVDILINNAGINIIESIDTINYNNWEKVIKINLTGPMKLIHNVAPLMKKNKYGKIINISSIWGIIAKEKRNSYASSKTGLIGLTRTTALDLAPFNILVNAVCPGFTLTELTKKSLSSQEMNNLKQRIPLGRMAKTEEIAKTVCFLSSELNTYITGQAITIDGGFTIQ